MALIPNFSVGQTLTASQIIFTDISTGSDVAIKDRQIFLQKSDGTYLVPTGTTTSYIDFPLGTNTLTKTVLDTDYALSVTMNWLNVSGVVLYTKTYLFNFPQYAWNFALQLLQTQAANPSIVNNANFWNNNVRLYVDIFNSDTAVTTGNDQYSANFCLSDASYLRNNQNLFY